MSAILDKSFLFVIKFWFKSRVLNIHKEDSGWLCLTWPQNPEAVLFSPDEAKSVCGKHFSCLHFTYLDDPMAPL